jgi:hypothetical protein
MVNRKDPKALGDFVATLRETFLCAKVADNLRSICNSEIIQRILKARVPHLAQGWNKRVQKKAKTGCEAVFEDLLEYLDEQVVELSGAYGLLAMEKTDMGAFQSQSWRKGSWLVLLVLVVKVSMEEVGELPLHHNQVHYIRPRKVHPPYLSRELVSIVRQDFIPLFSVRSLLMLTWMRGGGLLRLPGGVFVVCFQINQIYMQAGLQTSPFY